MVEKWGEGWYHLPRKWHYANKYGITLCLRHKIYPMCNPGNPPEGEQCKACREQLAKRNAKPREDGDDPYIEVFEGLRVCRVCCACEDEPHWPGCAFAEDGAGLGG